ncbi:MAG: haloacid dehalogenase [Anaerolineae bacterium]
MPGLDSIVQSLREQLELKNEAREATFNRSRNLIRLCANSIRAAHRAEFQQARELLQQANALATEMCLAVAEHPDLYFAGYTQDALKEYAEANITYAVITDEPVPTPAALQVEPPAYLNGLAEAIGELRRHVLDLIREEKLARAEQVLAVMDEAFWLLVTVDFPSAITGDLRRSTDMVRGVLERTRSDLTTAQGSTRLREALQRFEERLNGR